jgi:hypothetical protein
MQIATYKLSYSSIEDESCWTLTNKAYPILECTKEQLVVLVQTHASIIKHSPIRRIGSYRA